MDGKMINHMAVGISLLFHDQRRFRSAEVTRAFTSVIRAASRGSQSEVSDQYEVMIEPDTVPSEPQRRAGER
jgi:hypothetical protein